MADQLITQVERPNLSIDVNADAEVKEADASVEVDYADVKNGDDDSPKTQSGRYKALSRMFSRQYTPTIPKKTMFTDKDKNKHANNMDVIDEDTAPSKSIWKRIGSVFNSEDENDGVSPVDDDGPVEMVDDEEQFIEDDNEEALMALEMSGLLGRNPTDKKHCLVLDLDETLVHSSFRPVGKCDFILSINMDGMIHKVYVLKRPGVDEFLEEMSKYYELVIFTASLDKYANPLLDLLDPKGLISGRLFREHCTRRGQMYIKDLDRLGRRMNRTLIIDNSPYSYALHPYHAVPILSWFDDQSDEELLDMIPFLKDLTQAPDVSEVLDASKPWRVTNRKLKRKLEKQE